MKMRSEIVIAVLFILYTAVINGESDTIVLISPVLAPTSHANDTIAKTAKDFPVLMVLAGETNDITAEVAKNEENPQFVYVKKIIKADTFVQQRVKRQDFGLGLGSERQYFAARVQSRAPTVIVVPERGTAALPAYNTGPISPYSVNTPNRGTNVVISQVPEYNYNTVGRTYDIVPINPIRI